MSASPSRSATGIGSRVVLAIVAAMVLAGVGWLRFRERPPSLAPTRAGDTEEMGGIAPSLSAPAEREAFGSGNGSGSSNGSGGGPTERAAGATTPFAPPTVPRNSGAARVRIAGTLVDEHARPIDERRLREATTGEIPRIWFTRSGRRLAEFSLLPHGELFVDVVPPVDRTELRAEVTLAGRTFATFLEPTLDAPFTLRVELSALALDTSAATIVVRPAPQTAEPSDRYVVLFRDTLRRATWIDESGRARFPTLPAGEWCGVVCVDGELPVEFSLALGERDDLELLVLLAPGFRIRGEAAWDGLVAPLPPCVVVAARADAPPADATEPRPRLQGATAQLGGDGSFELGPFPAGRWRLQLLRVDGTPAILHEEVVTTGGREVERVNWQVTPARPPTRLVRLLFAWPGGLPPEPQGNVLIPRALLATFFGAGGAVVGRGLADPGAREPPQLPLPDGATVLELAWRDVADGRLLDSGVAITRIALPRVVQDGASSDLKVEFAEVPRD